MEHRRFGRVYWGALVSIILLVLIGCPGPATGSGVPTHAPTAVYYLYGSSACVRRAADESDVDSYVFYWGTGPGAKLGGIAAEIEATGEEYTNLSIPVDPPAEATHLLCYSANAYGEMSTGASHRLVYDYTEHSLAAEFGGGFCVAAADIDGDDDFDILGVAYQDDEIVWWENDELQTWPVHLIDTTCEQPESVFAADIDGDDDLDIACAYWDSYVRWWENDGTPGDGQWTGYDVGQAGLYACSVSVVDIDDDGIPDVLAAADANPGGGIVWFEGDGSPTDGGWTPHAVDGAGACRSVATADIDKDGNLDLVGAMSAASMVYWYRNDGSPGDGGWTQIAIGVESGANDVCVADMDSDGFSDVVAIGTGESEAGWYENPGTLVPDWSAYRLADTLGETLNDGRSIAVADMEGDGDIDAVVGAMAGVGLTWYENLGPPNSQFPDGLWKSHIGLSTSTACASVAAADIDGDGDTDVMAASWFGNRADWVEIE